MERDLHDTQREQAELVAGRRAGQLFPRGARELRKPEGMGKVVTKAGAVHFDPRRLKASQIVQAANTGRLPELLARRFASGGSVESDPVAWGATPVRESLSFDDLVPANRGISSKAPPFDTSKPYDAVNGSQKPNPFDRFDRPGVTFDDLIPGSSAKRSNPFDQFDPDKYLREKDKPFDPDAYLAGKEEQGPWKDYERGPWHDYQTSKSSHVGEGPKSRGAIPVDRGSSLSNSSDDTWLTGAAKGAGTAIIKGLGNSIGVFGNVGRFADYLMARADSAITGDKVEDVLARYAKHRAEMPRLIPSPESVLPIGEDIYSPILKRTGEYVPTTTPGRLAQAGVETAAGMLGPGGGAAARRVPASVALSSAVRMAPANAAAGSIGQGIADATGDPLAGLVGGTVLPATGGAIGRTIGKGVSATTRPFAEDLPVVGEAFSGTRDRMVGERLLKEAQQGEGLRSALRTRPEELVEGSKPTTGQLTGDIGILQAERRARTEDNTAFNERDAQQNSARQAALQGLAPDADTMRPSRMLQDHLDGIDEAANAALTRLHYGAHELASRLGPGAAPEAVGATIRDAVESTRKEAAAARRALYDAIDPDNSLALVASPVRDAAQKIARDIDPYGKPLTPDETRIIGRAQTLPDVMPIRSLLEMDKDIASSMAGERKAVGQSPAWYRLQQLKGAVQGAIDNAVDNQAKLQAGAVARGEMRAEDTIAAKLKAETDEWLARRLAETGAETRTGTGSYSVARSAPIPGAHRAEVQDRGRLRDAAGDQGLQGSPALLPNFDEGAAARLAAAKQGHAAYARLYKEGPVGQALKTMGFADNYVVPNSGLPARVIVRGDKGYETAKNFLKAARNNPEAVSAMQDHALAPLRQSLNPEGTINSAKFAAWKQNYAGALKALDEVSPGFSSRFDNAARASDILTEAGARAKRQIDDFQKSEAGKFLKLSDPVEVENRVGSMLADRTKGPTQMRALLAKLQSDPTAIDGLRKAGIDWMTRKFATTAEAGTSGEKALSSAAFRTFVRDNRATLSALYPPEQVNMFGRIAEDLDRANRSVTATAIKGSPGTAKDALPFLKRSVEEAKKHTSILGAAMAGSLLGFESAGLTGAVTGAGLGGGAYLLGSLRAAGIRKAEDMFRDALLNPERAKYYLSQVPPKLDGGAGYTLSRVIRHELMMAPVLTPREDVSKRKAELVKKSLSRPSVLAPAQGR